MLHWAMFRATCLAMALRDKLIEKLYSVTDNALIVTFDIIEFVFR